MAEGAEEPGERLQAADEELAAARQDGEPVRLARALVARVVCLQRLRRRTEALATIAEVIDAGFDVTELELRKRVADALWMRLSMRWRDADTEQTLAAARELFALCNREPVLGRTAASALGVQADAQRKLGDLRAAIATRRWLITEFADVRPRNRPALVFDQWFMLAQDLYADGQFSDTESTLSQLLAALEDADVRAPQHRTADAIRLRVLALWRLDQRAQSLAVNDELQRRFADSDEAGARNAAADGLVSLVAMYLNERAVPPAIAVAGELTARFDAETDPRALTHLGGELQTTAFFLSETPGPFSVMVLASLASRLPWSHPLTPTRPRLRRISWELARLECATVVNEALAARFADDLLPQRHALALQATLRRAFIICRNGHPVACVRLILQFTELGAPAVSAVVTGAQPSGPDRYPVPVWVAALMGTAVDLGTGPEADRTRAAIGRIVRAQRMNPAMDRFAARRADHMDARARRAVSGGGRLARVRGWSSRRS